MAPYQKVKFGSSALTISAVFFVFVFFFCFFVFFFLSVELECVQRPPIFSKWAIIMKNVQNRKTVYACTTVAFINDAARK